MYGGVRLPWSARYQAHQRTGRADIMLINEFELNLFWEQSSVPGHPQIPPGLASLGPSYGQVVYLPGETNRFINYSLVSYANSKCSTSYRPRTGLVRRSYEGPSGERSGVGPPPGPSDLSRHRINQQRGSEGAVPRQRAERSEKTGVWGRIPQEVR